MNRILVYGSATVFYATTVFCQSFTVHDLLDLADLPSKESIIICLKRILFPIITSRRYNTNHLYSHVKMRKKQHPIQRGVEFYQNNLSRYFIFHTLIPDDFIDGKRSLIKSGFIYDKKKDIDKDSLMLFQKRNISILASKQMKDSITEYTFKLKQRKIPDSIIYAEDLASI